MLLDQYCITCHNEKLKTGSVVLDTADVEHLAQDPALWERVAHMLRTGSMPPGGRPRPDAGVSLQLAASLERQLDQIEFASPIVGRIPPHRLNRTEYTNAIRDLFDLELPVSMLPADGSLLGFDNIAGVLSVSPTLLERYLSIARQVSRLAVGDSTMVIPPVEYLIESLAKQDDRPGEDLPFGSRGVVVKHHFPLDGEYSIKVTLARNGDSYIRGLGRDPQPIDIRLDGVHVTTFAQAGLTKGMPPPEGYTQDELGDPEWENNALEGDAGYEIRFHTKAGQHTVGVAMPAKHWESDEEFLLPTTLNRRDDRDLNILIRTVKISGPFDKSLPKDTASRRKLFTCYPANDAESLPCAQTILTSIAHRAYRRPLAETDIRPLMRFCQAGLAHGFEGCIQLGLERILASPHFLFRVEQIADASNPPSPLVRVSDVELASRLSFFLWSSIPDDQLLDLAGQGTLHEPAVLEQQVRRMIADPRSRSLVDNFAAQWLELRALETFAPAENVFPEYDAELRTAFREETERFIESNIREDRPVPELLTANYTFVNERLARHYQIPNVVGSHFRKVTLPANGPRVGILGQASVLMVTSQPTRTSPVLRGKFIMENILGTPVPPPPPNVPPLKTGDRNGQPQTVRELLEQHRASPVCASCHARMDPWGFALENFSALGAWRTADNKKTLDTAAALLDGTKLDGPAGVRRVLISRKNQFVDTVAEKLMVYALGRPVEYYDHPILRSITRDASAHDQRWSSLILGIVKSLPFQYQMRGVES
jgi:hypothetical protein